MFGCCCCWIGSLNAKRVRSNQTLAVIGINVTVASVLHRRRRLRFASFAFCASKKVTPNLRRVEIVRLVFRRCFFPLAVVMGLHTSRKGVCAFPSLRINVEDLRGSVYPHRSMHCLLRCCCCWNGFLQPHRFLFLSKCNEWARSP